MDASEHYCRGQEYLAQADALAVPGEPRTASMDFAVMAQAHFLAALAADRLAGTTERSDR